MSKFKVGDKVRCVDCSTKGHILKLGNIYEVASITEDNFIRLVGIKVHHKLSVGRFELVKPKHVLTPEEVFEHLRKGTKLEVFGRYNTRTGSVEKWLEAPPTEQITYNTIVTQRWRIKPEPEVIELNGKKYREIME